MTGPVPLPDGLLLTFYGDDFTGSSAVMEVLTFAGLPTVMFLAPPRPEQLRRFAGYRAIGVASTARAQSPAWMDANLPQAFSALADLAAPIAHYKICSTLDSSPQIGSIGRALDIGIPIFGRRPGAAAWQPIVIAAPAIGRYQAFGNLFAAHAGEVYRLDRHPVMRDHPVTPMHEADVRRHLAAQTARRIGLVDVAAIKDGSAGRRFDRELGEGRSVVALDVIDDDTLQWAGRLIWENRGAGIFAVGSQGVEYALVAHWRAAGLLPAAPARPSPVAVGRIIAASGSVSSVTAAQIDWAEANGFDVIPLEAAAVVEAAGWRVAVADAVSRGRASLSEGRSPLIVTARGPADPAVARMREAVGRARLDPAAGNARIGAGLGEAAARLVGETGIRRAVICGGDTSGFAVTEMGIYALEALAPLAPGSPLCRAFAPTPAIDGLEIALKGGQMGRADFFGSVRAGRAISEER
jgi:uncharacterized protein YgbK (DUF1537 family)